MSTLTKFALGLMGKLRPKPPRGSAQETIGLPEPVIEGGMPLLDAVRARRSGRAFLPDTLPDQTLSTLLWVAFGINRPESHGRTAPSALDAQEIEVFVALPEGTYRYEPELHRLMLVVSNDVRAVTGYQDFVAEAPLDLVFVANHSHLKLVPAAQRSSFAAAAAGAIAQNVYLFCAAEGLSTVIRAWIDRAALSDALGLSHDQEVVLAQTVGYPRPPEPD